MKVLVLIVMAASFSAGYLFVHKQKVEIERQSKETQARLTSSQAEIAQLQMELRLAKVRDELAHLVIEVKLGNFGKAREQSTQFLTI